MGYILGVNAPPTLLPPEQCPYGGHDPSACLVDEYGLIVMFEEQERHSRRRYGVFEYPIDAVRACLDFARADESAIDAVAVGWDVPRIGARTGERWTYDFTAEYLGRLGLDPSVRTPELLFIKHHRAHAASSFYGSGLTEAAVLVLDGNGEDESISLFHAQANGDLIHMLRLPQAFSLGNMYAAVSDHLKLGVLNAGKTMGLASYGRAQELQPWSLFRDEGQPLFDFDDEQQYDKIMVNWAKLLGGLTSPRRTPRHRMHEDLDCVRLAWSAQAAVEAQLRRLVDQARQETGVEDVCLSGGVALNCSANALIDGSVFCPPFPHDAGVAVGAAWAIRRPVARGLIDPFLGSPLAGDFPVGVSMVDIDLTQIATCLLEGKIGGIAAGRAEVGPRALGHRSLIALASTPGIRDRINKAKTREQWRPLAPVSLDSDAAQFWEVKNPLQRYMLAASEVTPHGRATIPEAVHVDGTARAQITIKEDGLLAAILAELRAMGAQPVLINTSLNARGEPICRTVDDALRTYEQAKLDFILFDDRMLIR